MPYFLKMEKGQFVFVLSAECEIDLATLDPAQWRKIKATVRYLINTKQCTDVGRAYIAAFLVFIQELSALAPEFDPTTDKMM